MALLLLSCMTWAHDCLFVAVGQRFGLRTARGHGAHDLWRIRECALAA